MKRICLYFQVHQPFRLKRYRFFDIGNDSYYFDDFLNEELMRSIATKCYLPANQLFLNLLKEYPQLRIAYSISGTALEQIESYAPELLNSFRELVETGQVELLAETYAHSLSSLYDPIEFVNQVMMHSRRIEAVFGVKPQVLCNSELIYSDDICAEVHALGFKGMLTEGAKHILGWKSPNYLYRSVAPHTLPLLLRNPKLSDEISAEFSNPNWQHYPLTADKMIQWIKDTPQEEQLFNLFMNYEVLGGLHEANTGIFDFFKALPLIAERNDIGFATPSEAIDMHEPIAEFSCLFPISWVGESKDLSNWMGNVLQEGSAEKLAQWGERTRLCQDQSILRDWIYLQSADHFYYMNTRQGGAGGFSTYESPYDAFNNYMNVLSDFFLRVEARYPSSIENEELNALLQTIHNQDVQIQKLEEKLAKKVKRIS